MHGQQPPTLIKFFARFWNWSTPYSCGEWLLDTSTLYIYEYRYRHHPGMASIKSQRSIGVSGFYDTVLKKGVPVQYSTRKKDLGRLLT